MGFNIVSDYPPKQNCLPRPVWTNLKTAKTKGGIREIQPSKVVEAHKDVTFECNPYFNLDFQKFWIELKIGFVDIFH